MKCVPKFVTVMILVDDILYYALNVYDTIGMISMCDTNNRNNTLTL